MSQLKATNRIIEDKVICIGLPYNMRIKQNKKELLNIIYRMENNKIQEQIIPITFKNSNDDNEGIVDIPKDSEKIQVIEENSSMPSTIRYYRELLNETNEEDSEEDVEWIPVKIAKLACYSHLNSQEVSLYLFCV